MGCDVLLYLPPCVVLVRLVRVNGVRCGCDLTVNEWCVGVECGGDHSEIDSFLGPSLGPSDGGHPREGRSRGRWGRSRGREGGRGVCGSLVWLLL